MTLHTGLRRFALAAVLIAMLGACGGGSTSTSAPVTGAATTAPATTDTGAAETPAEESSEATTSQGGTSGAESQTTASGIVVPKQVGSASYTASEYTGDQLAMFLPFKADDLDAVLDAQGKTRDDVLLVVAVPGDMAYPTVFAIRINGGQGQALADAVAAGSLGEQTWSSVTMGGKPVNTATGASATHVLYAPGDVMYEVDGTDAGQLETVVGLLP